MASIKNTISISGSITGYLIVVLKKTTAPTVEVARVVYTAGVSSNPFNYEFTDLVDGTYIVTIHESTNGTTLGAVRHDYWIDATSSKITRQIVTFIVGSGIDNAPNGGDTEYNKTSIATGVINFVFQNGYGFLIPGVDWEPIVTGGFRLLGGRSFSDSEPWFYELQTTETVTAAAPTDPYSNVIFKTADATLTTGDLNKTVVVEATGNKQITTLPAVAAVSDAKGYIIEHGKANAVNVIVKANGSELIRFRGEDVNEIALGAGEWVKLVRVTVSSAPKWYVITYSGNWDRIGEVGYDRAAGRLNTVTADGSEYDLSVYVRLKKYVDSLPASQIVTYTQFNAVATINGESVYPNRGFFALDTVNNKVKVPDLLDKFIRGIKNLSGVDTERVDNKPGGYQHDAIREHEHNRMEGENTGHGSSSSIQTAPLVKLLVNISAGQVTTISKVKVSGVVNAGQDTRGKNVGLIPIIYI